MSLMVVYVTTFSKGNGVRSFLCHIYLQFLKQLHWIIACNSISNHCLDARSFHILSADIIYYYVCLHFDLKAPLGPFVKLKICFGMKIMSFFWFLVLSPSYDLITDFTTSQFYLLQISAAETVWKTLMARQKWFVS